MPRPGELTYFEAIGEQGRRHSLTKPFSVRDCPYRLMQVGAVMAVLPPPPARVLDCGCGTGWLSYMLQRRGYEVVGTDVSAHAIDLARFNPPFRNQAPPTFLVLDSEDLEFDSEFDAVLFFDSLHHSLDERRALGGAYRALRRGGVCVTSEPGRGHHASAQEAIDRYDVTEKDMPSDYIVKLGRQVGFRSARIYPRWDEVGRYVYGGAPEPTTALKRALRWGPLGYLIANYVMALRKRDRGIVVLRKGA
jgi:SAM-dependent methyltransferase